MPCQERFLQMSQMYFQTGLLSGTQSKAASPMILQGFLLSCRLPDEVLNKIYPQAELGTCIELSLEINKDIDFMNQYKNEIKVLDNKVSEIKNKLKSMIGFNEYGDSGNYIIHWSNIHKSAYTVAEKDYRELRIKVKEIKNEEV